MKLLQFAMEHNYFYYGGHFYLQGTGVAIGAKFAPSLAGLFMALWENDKLFSLDEPRLLFWHCYIDDAFFLWKGDEGSLHTFMTQLNTNNWEIKFTYEYSSTSVNFLDLVIFKEQSSLLTKNTDRNGYIPLDSGHHPKWLKAILKGQFQSIRRNCSHIEDF